MTESSTAARPGPFDRVAEWKAQAAIDLALDGADLIAALSPGPAFPTVLHGLVRALPPLTPESTIVDLGAGTGGITTWIAHQTGAVVVGVEPAEGSRRAGHRLFPDLDVRQGTAEASGLADGEADVVVLIGVVSLLDALGPVCREVRRLLKPGGVLGIADMFLSDATRQRDGANTLRSLGATISELRDHHLATIAVGCANDARPAPTWSAAADRLHARMCADHAGHPDLTEWLADQTKLHRWIDTGQVYGAYLLARPFCSNGRATATA